MVKRLSFIIIAILTVLVVLLAGCGLVGGQSETARKRQAKPKIAGKYDFSRNTAGDYIPTDWYSWGGSG